MIQRFLHFLHFINNFSVTGTSTFLLLLILHLLFYQAPKFHTLAITIYRCRNFDLTVMIAKIVQNFLETAKNESNTLLERESFKKNFHQVHHGILTQALSLYYIY